MKKEKTSIFMAILAALVLATQTSHISNTNVIHAEPHAAPILYVSPASYTPKKVGEVFQIQIKVQQAFGLFRYDFKVGFNATLLKCLNLSQGDFFPRYKSTSTIQINNTSGNANINCTLKPEEAPISGSGNLAFIEFNATYGVPYLATRKSCLFDIYDSHLYGAETPPSPIEHGVQDGAYYTPWIAPELELTLTASKDSYCLDENIVVSGSLTGNGYPINTAYVAIEVYNPKHTNQPIIARTVPTGTIPPAGPMEILSAIACDLQTGLPKTSFQRGQYASVKVSVKNNSDKQQTVLITVNVYDSKNATQGVLYTTKTIEPGQTLDTIKSFYIESTFAVGTAKAYANVFSDWVKNGGTALCNEKQATFTVTSTALSETAKIATTSVDVLVAGNYEISFKISYTGKEAFGGNPTGTYMVHACSIFMEKTVSNSKELQVKLGGDVNNDRKTDLTDLVLLAKAYGSNPDSVNWNPDADLNEDNLVSLSDLVLLAINYGKEL